MEEGDRPAAPKVISFVVCNTLGAFNLHHCMTCSLSVPSTLRIWGCSPGWQGCPILDTHFHNCVDTQSHVHGKSPSTRHTTLVIWLGDMRSVFSMRHTALPADTWDHNPSQHQLTRRS